MNAHRLMARNIFAKHGEMSVQEAARIVSEFPDEACTALCALQPEDAKLAVIEALNLRHQRLAAASRAESIAMPNDQLHQGDQNDRGSENDGSSIGETGAEDDRPSEVSPDAEGSPAGGEAGGLNAEATNPSQGQGAAG